MYKYSNLLKELKKKSNHQKAISCARFFKTKKGEYGEKYLFLGIMMPELRQLAKKYSSLSLFEIEKLLKNKYYEVRLCVLIILVNKYKKASIKKDINESKKIYKFYLKNTKYINNWGLVDLSAHQILGNYLSDNFTTRQNATRKKILERLAKSKNLWERRIAVVSTFSFIIIGEPKWTFYIVKILLKDQEDLIHKACGWMLREIGKHASKAKLRVFLDNYGPQMPRTMLRYAIERFSSNERKYYIKK